MRRLRRRKATGGSVRHASDSDDALLEAFKRDRAWNDGGARKQLLQFFEAWGLMDPSTVAARRKLSAVWF